MAQLHERDEMPFIDGLHPKIPASEGSRPESSGGRPINVEGRWHPAERRLDEDAR
jgi:hypothetical protein